jgi:hypothetical protein
MIPMNITAAYIDPMAFIKSCDVDLDYKKQNVNKKLKVKPLVSHKQWYNWA